MLQEEINKAVEVLRSGGVILYPTDTVWGIGCDATNAEAVERIYKLKGSVNKKGMIVLVDEPTTVGRYIKRVPEVAWDLLELSDKPLTLILDGAVGVAPNLIPEEGSLAVRVADHDFCRGVVRRLRRGLVSTSANFSISVACNTYCTGIPPRRPPKVDCCWTKERAPVFFCTALESFSATSICV